MCDFDAEKLAYIVANTLPCHSIAFYHVLCLYISTSLATSSIFSRCLRGFHVIMNQSFVAVAAAMDAPWVTLCISQSITKKEKKMRKMVDEGGAVAEEEQ
jgi:hypothetical protein